MFEQEFLQIHGVQESTDLADGPNSNVVTIDEMRNKQFLECPNHLSATGDLFLQFLIVSCISFAALVSNLKINHGL